MIRYCMGLTRFMRNRFTSCSAAQVEMSSRNHFSVRAMLDTAIFRRIRTAAGRFAGKKAER